MLSDIRMDLVHAWQADAEAQLNRAGPDDPAGAWRAGRRSLVATISTVRGVPARVDGGRASQAVGSAADLPAGATVRSSRGDRELERDRTMNRLMRSF
jgi:hypothetical protein